MRVNFLGASDGTPLSKTFKEIAPGNFKETSYPHIANFNSIEREVSNSYEFYLQIVACAAEGLCLLKGELDRPLINESRAGHTTATQPTRWLCLDIDCTITTMTPQQFLDQLLGVPGVSYTFQYSASQGIKNNQGWRGHFFILLDSAASPQALKQWLIQRNLDCTSLQPHIGVSASGGALTYPLDVTTCQNDKLIYISPPNCVGFDDPLTERFVHVQGSLDTLHLELGAANAAANQQAIKRLLAEKRKQKGFEKKTFRTTNYQGLEVLTNPDPVTVTGRKEERGFVYLNLNGGDSWGYYFPENSPDVLFNFKGEPCMYMWDVDKDIYNEYTKNTAVNTGDSGNAIPFGFLWPNDDCYYRGFANPDTGELIWLQPTGSKGKLRDFFVQHGVNPPSGWAVDEWKLEFDPTTEGAANFSTKTVNTYKSTKYLLNARLVTTPYIPPTIDRVLSSVCVDQQTKDHFLNWLAAIFQTRLKTTTAWIFQGVQGTGKGVLFTQIIAPLIGRQYCHEMTMDRLDDDFNAYLSDNIVLFIDEAKISDSKNGDRLLNRIKNLITEPEQHIRGMRRNAVVRPNYSNIILASNYDEIIPMEVSDRRFNVAPRQEKSIQLGYNDIVSISNELPEFANYLHSYRIDIPQTRQVLFSEAREKLIKVSETTITSFFQALAAGNLGYFTQYLDSGVKMDIEGMRYHDYAAVIRRWISEANKASNVSRNELRTCYQFLQGATISATKFTKMCIRHGFDMVPVRVDGEVTRGIRGVMWVLSEEEIEQHKEDAKNNVVSFRERK